MYSVRENINRFSYIINKAACILSQFTVALMVITVLVSVFMRYFLKSPLAWGDELSRYCLVFMTFIGASVALREKQLAAMELIVEKVPLLARNILALVTYLLEILLLGFLFYYSIKLIGQGSVKAQLSPALQVPMTWIYSSLPLGIGLMLVQTIVLTINSILNVVYNRKEEQL
jgi:TRAP-type C4-dicarboxylate transport system permease small subunit